MVATEKSTLLLSFEQYLKNEKKAASNTQASYMRDLEQLEDWLYRNDCGEMQSVAREDLEAYIAFLENEGRSTATVTRTIATIHSFYRWMCLTGQRADNPSENIRTRKVEKKIPRILTEEEMECLLAQPDCREKKGLRDRAMLELLCATGMRVSELIEMDVEDLDLKKNTVHCTGSSEREIPIPADKARILREYLKEVRPALAQPEEAALFVNMSGKRMTRQGFWKLLKSYQTKAGIQTEITPGILRHSCAAHLLENGADLESVQEMLGHAEASSTQVYSLLLDQAPEEMYGQSHAPVSVNANMQNS